MNYTRLHISKVPDTVHDQVADDVLRFSVGLTKISRTETGEKVVLIGSGTLISIGSMYGILTAHHVAEVLSNLDTLGVMCEVSGPSRRHAFDSKYLIIHKIARGSVDSEGPDLAVIQLPVQGIGYIRSSKSFYDLVKASERSRSHLIPFEFGFWFSFGVIGETRKDLGPDSRFNSVTGYQALCGMSGNPRTCVVDDYDYLEILVDWEGREKDIPRTFGGMSGGGIWQVEMVVSANGLIEPLSPILSGMVFYETEVVGGQRKLRGHGRQSIHEAVLKHFEGISRNT